MKNSGEPDIRFRDRHFNESSDDQEANVPLLSLKPPSSNYAYRQSSKPPISDELRHFQISLKWCALDHSSCTGKVISYLTFIFFTIVVPIVSSVAVRVPASSPAEDPFSFNKLVHLPESGLAAIGFFTLCGFFKRYDLLQILDNLHDDSLRQGYITELDKSFRYLAWILLPSFLVELSHKIIFFLMVKVSLPSYLITPTSIPLNSIAFILVLLSWVYRTGVFLLVCVLFRLNCQLQILRFEGFRKQLEEAGCESDSGIIFREHVRIRKELLVTSHRYRFFIIGCLVTLTVSQFGSLLLVLTSKSKKSFFNSGDLVVCSAVQISGFFLCLIGAARITHRAQGIVSVATRWHMLLTCAASNSNGTFSSSLSSEQCKDKVTPTAVTNETTDLTSTTPSVASTDCGGHRHCDSQNSSSDILITAQDQDHHSSNFSFQTRQALVTYLQHNNGGITLYGFALDRGLLHTLFAFEFSLVLWILSKVVVLSSS